eukprot:gnl/MRDRNA2_/MRDRNA2_122799_c0_seq1.p1 gnl/MRDRNA2_/MRDRNA2_122799_c0~~gnl/MRDRNA2_/MRDRNA2_122799_c0_seq1.p1  ORF type:complete len:246 (-),score=41.46 gnl/MRDRNA2_/MRDRNA2_122799_c0_seq1:135-872(-)
MPPKSGALGVEVVQRFSLPNGLVLCVSTGSIERFRGDAIVNAANEGCVGGGGVDKAIAIAGGQKLLDARKQLPQHNGKRCETGKAVVTIGGGLPVKWCIHAVAPRYPAKGTAEASNMKKLMECDGLVESAYTKAMQLACQNKVCILAFPILGGGIFKGCRSLEAVVDAGVRGILATAYEGLEQVHIVCFPADKEALPIVLQTCSALAEPPGVPNDAAVPSDAVVANGSITDTFGDPAYQQGSPRS